MGTKGFAAPFFGRHAGIKGLSKSGASGRNTLPPGSEIITDANGVLLLTDNGEALRT